MSYAFQANSSQTGAELAVSIFDAVNTTFMDVKYADLLWREIVPQNAVKTDIPAGAQNYVQPIRDRTGAAQFMGKGASPRNIPSVGVSLGAMTAPLAWSATSASVTNEDARVYAHGNLGSLSQDLGEVMKVACENLIETATVFGAAEVGFQGWLSYSGITATTAAATGTGNTTTWSTKTAALMVADVNAAIMYVYNATRTIFIPGTVFLPPAQFMLLATTPMVIGTASLAQSALEYLKKNNAYTALRGKEVEIKSIRYLKGAGAGSTDRMVLQDVNPKHQYLPFALPYRMGAPVPEGLGATFYAEQKFGSYVILQPGTTLYVDGI
jgi:hypothetical protein